MRILVQHQVIKTPGVEGRKGKVPQEREHVEREGEGVEIVQL